MHKNRTYNIVQKDLTDKSLFYKCTVVYVKELTIEKVFWHRREPHKAAVLGVDDYTDGKKKH